MTDYASRLRLSLMLGDMISSEETSIADLESIIRTRQGMRQDVFHEVEELEVRRDRLDGLIKKRQLILDGLFDDGKTYTYSEASPEKHADDPRL